MLQLTSLPEAGGSLREGSSHLVDDAVGMVENDYRLVE